MLSSGFAAVPALPWPKPGWLETRHLSRLLRRLLLESLRPPMCTRARHGRCLPARASDVAA
eukprot:364972-Chlamydomonas_euryale.AAC.6